MIGYEPNFKIVWGEVIYDGNQVYLRDVGKNRIVLRVTLDGSGKPVASYMNNQTDNAEGAFLKDTVYYHYSGDRLDYMIQIYELRLYVHEPLHRWEKYSFDYDAHGNMIGWEGFVATSRMNFIYDHSKPISGMVSNYIITTSFRLMEFLELIKVPMHHALIETNYGHFTPTGGFREVFEHQYKNYVINNGLVHSYQLDMDPAFPNISTFYNGWNCGAAASQPNNRQNNVVTSLPQFEKLYPSGK